MEQNVWPRTHFLTLLDVDVHTVRVALEDEGDTFENETTLAEGNGVDSVLPLESTSHVQGYLEM